MNNLAMIRVPIDLLVAEEKLVMNLYVYSPAERKLRHYGQKESVLSTTDLISLMRLAPSQLLMPQSEYREACKRRAEMELDR